MARHFVLVCQGPNCKVQGSVELRDHFRAAVAEARTSKNTAVLPYNCFDRCGRGPNVVIYPDGIWYEGVETQDIPAILKQLDGGPVPERLLGDVDQSHADAYYQLIEEVLPELVGEEHQLTETRKRGWWPF